MNKRQVLIGATALAAALLGAFAAIQLLRPSESEAATRALLALSLPDAAGRATPLAQWKGKPMVVNFWATWCPPCREEMPMLAAAAQSPAAQGIQFVGIAMDDARAVAAYAENSPAPYPLLVTGMEIGPLMARLGNGAQALPFTVFLDRDGALHQVKLGELKAAELDARLQELSAQK
ncbi:TlpA family protein disulfide reductase [Uliginosibacterium sp. H1]|uniref:TlpA family protein disulfide reductase n=1 Tax=Uliginosibacterium sp. H1 TaxID=3114757 RepID=UPI002E1965F7|nr:TlpA disulfide reductase family protein [Uliginosibacterium sp. H1]